MILRVSFTLNGQRKTPITNTYRPDWTSASKPGYNGGQLTLSLGTDLLTAGQTAEGTIQPIAPEYWGGVKVGDVLRAMEGLNQSGEATVLSIEETA